MERKHFLKASLCLGAFCGLRPVLGAEEKPAGDEKPAAPPPPNPCAGALGYAAHWVKDLMDQADVQLTEPQRKALMEPAVDRARRAAPRGEAEPFKGRLDEFVADLAAHMGKDAVQRDGDVVKVSYPRCFCPLVAELKEPLSASYCFCSAGWLKEVYETVSGKPVTVEILETR